MKIRKKLDCFSLVRFCKGQTNNKWHFFRHFKAHPPVWRDIFSFSIIQAFSRLLTTKKGNLLFELGHQKCHLTLWLTLSSPTCYLVTLSLPPLKSRVLFEVPLTPISASYSSYFCTACISLFLKWFLHYLFFFIFEVHEFSTTCTVVVFNDDFAEKKLLLLQCRTKFASLLHKNLRHEVFCIYVRTHFAKLF